MSPPRPDYSGKLGAQYISKFCGGTHTQFFLLLFLLGIRMTFYFWKLHRNVPIPYNQFCLSVFFPGKDPGGDKCGIPQEVVSGVKSAHQSSLSQGGCVGSKVSPSVFIKPKGRWFDNGPM